MKKSIIALSIVALGASWVGSSWFFGKKIEENKDIRIALVNNEIDALIKEMGKQNPDFKHAAPKVQVTLESFERGIMSSNAKFSLSEKGKNGKEKIYFNTKIEHGPFPLSEVASFNLSPKASAVYVTLDNTELTKPVFDFTKGQDPFVLKVVSDLSGSNFRSEFNTAPINHNMIEVSAISIVSTANKDLSKVEGYGNLDKLRISAPEGEFTINSLSVNSDLKKAEFINFAGKQTINFKSVEFKPKKHSPVTSVRFDNIVITSDLSEDQSNINYDTNVAFNQILLNNKNFGSFDIGFHLSNLNGKALKAIMDDLNEYAKEAQYNKQLDKEVFVKNVEALLSNGPVFDMPITLKNSAGTSHYKIKAELQKFSLDQIEGLDEEAALAKLLKSFDVDFSISIPMVKEIILSAADISGMISRSDAEAKFDEEIKKLPMYLQQFDQKKMLTYADNKLTTKIHYENNVITVNNEKMSLSEFAQRIGK